MFGCRKSGHRSTHPSAKQSFLLVHYLTLVLRDLHVCGIVVPGCVAAPAYMYMRIRRYRYLVIQSSRPIKINVLSMFGSVAISNGKNVLPLYRTLLLVLQVSHVTFSEISAADQDGKLLATNWDAFQQFKRRF